MRSVPSASQITYTNTIADAVRMLGDEALLLPPARAGVVRDVAAAFLSEQDTRANMPVSSFNMLASPATCRLAAAGVMMRLADGVIAAASEGNDAAALVARDVVSATLTRLVSNGGLRASNETALHERASLRSAINVVNARVFYHEYPSGRGAYGAYDQPEAVADAYGMREALLGETMDNALRWAMDKAFKESLRGETTAGRMLAVLGVAMTPEHLALHRPAATPAARSLRELQLVANVLASEVQQPGSSLGGMALDDYHFRLKRLQLQSEPVAAETLARAGKTALEYAARVSGVLGELIEQRDGWTRPGIVPGAASFSVPPASRLQ